MPVEDHAVHEKVREKEGAKYGCWNKPRPTFGQWMIGGGYGYEYRFSTECRYDMSLTDSKCDGCEWRGSGEAYDAMVRSKGK